jgi:hypothetical protein
VFLLFADNGGCHRRRGKEEGMKSIQTPLLLGFSCGGAWVTVVRGEDTPPLFPCTVPAYSRSLWMF